MDFLISSIGLLVLSPVFILIYLYMIITTKDSPFFFQERPGMGERVFRIMKFKTMTDARDNDGNLLPDNERVTKLGNFMRKFSLDEIPQLINVVKGDMSLIGPRPLRVHYLPYYTHKEQLRHTVRPGITGLAQVSGRNAISWDEKLEKDVEYVENMSFFLDLKILLKTAQKVLKGSDVILMQGPMLPFDQYRRIQQKNSGLKK
nr:sugar transferase [Allomuricauda beolgyonensis]